MSHNYRLSLEELAFALGVIGGVDVASAFLVTTLGKLKDDDLSGRLTAASHSLLARELMTIEQGKGKLEAGLAEVATAIVASTHTIRCNEVGRDGERVVTFFVSDAVIIEHELKNGVVAVLTRLPDTQAIVTRLAEFVTNGQTQVDAPAGTIGVIPVSVLEQFNRATPAQTAEQSRQDLVKTGIERSVAAKLAQDLASATARGSALLITSDAEGAPVSNRGFLFSKGSQHLWLFNIQPTDPPQAEIYPGTHENLIRLGRLLLNVDPTLG
jgi:hypothetical protein